MRLTMHNGRTNKDGSYSAHHNDRNFNLDDAPHINKEKTKNNWIWLSDKANPEETTIIEHELNIYKNLFSDGLNSRNERCIKQRHKERIQNIEQYHKSEKTCPEEQIIQVGDKTESIDSKLLTKLVIDYVNWHLKNFKNIKILDIALHLDETTPHFHIRKVYVAHDKYGYYTVNQNKCLEENGIKRPNLDKKISRHNNAKKTYTKMCRDKLLELCKVYKIEVEETPISASRENLSVLEYKTKQERENLELLLNEQKEVKDNISSLKQQKTTLETDVSNLKQQNRTLDSEKSAKNMNIIMQQMQLSDIDRQRNKKLKEVEQLENQKTTLNNTLSDLKQQIDDLKQQKDKESLKKELELQIKESELLREEFKLNENYNFIEKQQQNLINDINDFNNRVLAKAKELVENQILQDAILKDKKETLVPKYLDIMQQLTTQAIDSAKRKNKQISNNSSYESQNFDREHNKTDLDL